MGKDFPYGIVCLCTAPVVADKVLSECFKLAESIHLRICLAYGLCLGFVRDGGYIVGDNDLDMIAITDTGGPTPFVDKAFIDAGFKRGASFPPPLSNVHYHKGRILVDIHFRESVNLYRKFDVVTYKGILYATPHPIDAYLVACYGDWRKKGTKSATYR